MICSLWDVHENSQYCKFAENHFIGPRGKGPRDYAVRALTVDRMQRTMGRLKRFSVEDGKTLVLNTLAYSVYSS